VGLGYWERTDSDFFRAVFLAYIQYDSVIPAPPAPPPAPIYTRGVQTVDQGITMPDNDHFSGDAKVTYTKSHIGDDSQFMFTYAAKSGYSGGPVLDASGNVIGMTASATCTSANCMDGFKQTFSMRASTIEEVERLEETIAQHVDTNIATSLPIIYRFLDKNKIAYEMSDAIGAPDNERINQIAQSVANIRCPSEEKSLVENAGVVRTKP
jgi:S1-C subfamily serine protease